MEASKKISRFLRPTDQSDQDEPGPTDVNSIFAAAPPCPGNDTFLAALQIPAATGLSYCGMKVGSTPCHASHAVPIYDPDGALCNGLFLKHLGEKNFEEIFVPGAQLANRFARVGARTDTILITESYVTAQRLHHATGYCVAVAFFVENIEAVCKTLAKKYPGSRLIVFVEAGETVHSRHRTNATFCAAANGGALVANSDDEMGSNGEDIEFYMPVLRNAVANAFLPNTGTSSPPIMTNLEHDAPMPWSRPLNGNALLENVVATIGKYVVLPAHAILTMALWVFFTHFIDIFNIAPILALCSPEKRCGKTTSEELLGALSYRPMLMSNITPAGFYQAIDGSCATMIIDECDTFLFPSQQLIGMINAGYKRKGAKVVRGGSSSKANSYNIFGARALAMIGAAPSSIEDRSLVIWQRRKKPTEIVERLSDAEEGDFIVLRSQISRWAADNMNTVREAKIARPDLSSDRAIDNWMPLLAIASCISKECLERAKTAAHALYESQVDDSMSVGEELLSDIRSVFANHYDKRISTKTLIAGLCMNRERPWASFDNRSPISARQLSTHLAKYGIKSKNIRIGDDVPKGYELDQFTDAFERYLPGIDTPE